MDPHVYQDAVFSTRKLFCGHDQCHSLHLSVVLMFRLIGVLDVLVYLCVCRKTCLCVSDRIGAPGTAGEGAKIHHETTRKSSFYQNSCSLLVSNETGSVPALVSASQTVSLIFTGSHHIKPKQKSNWTRQI